MSSGSSPVGSTPRSGDGRAVPGMVCALALALVAPLAAPPAAAGGGSWPDLPEFRPATYRQIALHGGQLEGPGGIPIRYRDGDPLDAEEADLRLRRRTAEAARAALDLVHPLLHETLDLPRPEALDVVIVPELEDGRVRHVPAAPLRRPALLLVAVDPRSDEAATRRAVATGYVRVAAAEAAWGLSPDWVEALAAWAAIETEGGPDGPTAALLGRRTADLGDGLFDAASAAEGGNALWLAFLDEAHGAHAVRAALAALRGPQPAEVALDAVLRGTLDVSLAGALREFQVWSLLSGARDDGKHFSFGTRIEAAPFVSTESGLPALSVQSNPGVAPWGAAQLRLDPGLRDGGLRLTFEGDFQTRWDADLLLLDGTGAKRRLPLALEAGRGEIAVPLQSVDAAWLLIRNVGGETDAAARYTVAAHHDAGYPVEFGRLDVAPTEGKPAGRLVSWETLAEEDLVGFNVLRRRGPSGTAVPVHGVWIPALGRPHRSTSYRLVDVAAEPGASYEYLVEAITRDGLTVRSAPIASAP